MKLESITLKNYRSVKSVSFLFNQIKDKSFTYGLIGENEAGKSSILKGIAIKDSNNAINVTKRDFTNKDEYIDIRFEYVLDNKENDIVKNLIKKTFIDEKINESKIKNLAVEFSKKEENLHVDYYLEYSNDENDLDYYLIETNTELYNFIKENFHKTIFWSYDDKFLISKEILISNFFTNPLEVSVPLTNCFLLAGYKLEDFPKLLQNIISDSTEREEVRERLGEVVTKHIKRVWKNHDIKISFDLTSDKLNFHVKDLKSKGKSKTADQRSDGFKRFISFLLTISAQHKNSQLNNTILLIDEPETHLHPKAQEFFLEELIEISKSNNNIVLFATHSNYFIDKNHLERNYKVLKNGDFTELKKFDEKKSSYASVNYDVFNIISNDYHNELYSIAQDLSGETDSKKFDLLIKEKIKKTPIKKNYQHTNGTKFDCSLPTYIRHQIHHPENDLNPKFKENDLNESIEILKELIENLTQTKRNDE